MKNRWLALLLALCLLTALPAGALAEETEVCSQPVDEEVLESEDFEIAFEINSAEVEDEEPPAEANEEPPAEDAPDAQAAPEPAEAQKLTAVADLPEFVEGFAAVLTEVNAMTDDAGALVVENLPVGTVLYAMRVAEEPLIRVCYDANGLAVWARMDPAALRPVEAEEAAAYVEAARAREDALWLMEGVPLTRIETAQNAEDAQALRLNAEALNLGVGETFALLAEDPEAAGALSFVVTDAAIVSVSPEGVVTALAEGQAEIYVTAESGASAVCPVTVSAPVANVTTSIQFIPSSLVLGVGETSDLLQTIYDQDGKPVELAVDYASKNTKNVTVSADGTVKALKKGASEITAISADGMIAACQVTVLKAPSKITVTPATLKLGVGETVQMLYTLPKSSAASVTWTSSDPSVASIDPLTGEVTGVNPGAVQITARTHNGKKKSVKATVFAETTSVTFPQETMNVSVGEKVTLRAQVNPGASDELTYTADSGIVTIKGNVMTVKSAGTVTITATSYNGLSATCLVTVKAAPSYVRLPYSSLVLGVGDELQLTPDTGGATDQFTYKSSKSTVCSVSATGLLKARKVGSANITIKTYNKKTFKLKVKVTSSAETMIAVPSEYEMEVGDSFTAGFELAGQPGTGAKFASSDSGVIVVDANTGLVTGVSQGEADVIIYTPAGRVVTCHVTVGSTSTGIKLDKTDYALGLGETEKLQVTYKGGSLSSLTYESSNPGVVTVSSDGALTAVGKGSAEIIVRAPDPTVFATARAQVYDAPSDVLLDVSILEMKSGESYTLIPIIPEGSRSAFAYASSDEKVATVDSKGVVKAVGGGEATVTVTTFNGKSAQAKVTVIDVGTPTSIYLLENVPELNVGETYQVQVGVEPEGATPALKWSSSNTSVAKVSDAGLITAVNAGTATIKAVSQKNEALTVSISLKVNQDENLTLIIPERTTSESGIKENLAKIDAIRRSAIYEIDRLNRNGTISSSDASKRKSMVNNIFANYAFPWKTLKLQKYWKEANSEGGVKDFKTDRVYYGLPYISGSGKNRQYDVELALDENRYYDSGDGYYILNQNNLLSGKYVGNDCSGLCNVSIWGTGSSRASDRTDDIASSKYYKTISDTTDMRPGDLICKSSSHVIMFLYYTNADKTEFMMIENGGAEPGTNTVHCDIYEMSYYTSRGYKIRRLATLD